MIDKRHQVEIRGCSFLWEAVGRGLKDRDIGRISV